MYVSVTAGSTCSLLNSDPLRHSCQSLRCRRESGREELSQGSDALVITLAGYLSLSLLLFHVEREPLCSISHWMAALPHCSLLEKRLSKKSDKKVICSGKIVSVVFLGSRWDFTRWKMPDRPLAENSTVSDRSQNFSSSHICTSTGKWNLSHTWPERTGGICQVAARSTSFWHFDIGEIYKVLGCC